MTRDAMSNLAAVGGHGSADPSDVWCRVPPSTISVPPVVALTIWTALGLYVAGEAGRALRPPAPWARPAWLLGSFVYLGHIAAAFEIHHDWSHAAAYAQTAARTAALVGLEWGGGLWVNYTFTALWVAEGLWWQLAPAHYARRPPVFTTAVRGVFLFMIANGAVVFVSWPRRGLGIGILWALIWIWWSGRRNRHLRKQHPDPASALTGVEAHVVSQAPSTSRRAPIGNTAAHSSRE